MTVSHEAPLSGSLHALFHVAVQNVPHDVTDNVVLKVDPFFHEQVVHAIVVEVEAVLLAPVVCWGQRPVEERPHLPVGRDVEGVDDSHQTREVPGQSVGSDSGVDGPVRPVEVGVVAEPAMEEGCLRLSQQEAVAAVEVLDLNADDHGLVVEIV